MPVTLKTRPNAIPTSLELKLRTHCRELQVIPEVAQKAIDLVQDPDCSMPEFCNVVNEDVKLATDILSIANSAIYATHKPAVALRQAVHRLGLRRCRNLIVATCVASLSRTLPIPNEYVRRTLVRHGFLTATIATELNRTLNLGFQGEEVPSGLLHDFGRMLLALSMPDEFSDIDPMTFEEDPDQLLQEELRAGADHCAVGSWFAKYKGLPAEFVDVIRMHHQPENAKSSSRLVAVIAFADDIANHLARQGTAFNYNVDDYPFLETLEGAGTDPDLGPAVREIMLTAEAKADELLQR